MLTASNHFEEEKQPASDQFLSATFEAVKSQLLKESPNEHPLDELVVKLAKIEFCLQLAPNQPEKSLQLLAVLEPQIWSALFSIPHYRDYTSNNRAYSFYELSLTILIGKVFFDLIISLYKAGIEIDEVLKLIAPRLLEFGVIQERILQFLLRTLVGLADKHESAEKVLALLLERYEKSAPDSTSKLYPLACQVMRDAAFCFENLGSSSIELYFSLLQTFDKFNFPAAKILPLFHIEHLKSGANPNRCFYQFSLDNIAYGYYRTARLEEYKESFSASAHTLWLKFAYKRVSESNLDFSGDDKYLLKAKELITQYILSFNEKERNEVLERILQNTADDPLSKFFWIQRGIRKPDLSRGELAILNKSYGLFKTSLPNQSSQHQPARETQNRGSLSK